VGSRQLGYVVRRRIGALDPERDNEEVTRLSLEVLYGDPLMVHGLYLVAFARQMAVPSIARVVHRGGGGDMMGDSARRNDDTLTFFGEYLRRGYSSPEGQAAIARMETIHGRFRITDEQKRYTLASLMFEGDRIAGHLGLDPFTEHERQARWHFWRGVAERMPLGGLPDTRDGFWHWTLDYERDSWRYTDGGRVVVDTLFEDWTTRWFPPGGRRFGRQVLLALMDGQLRAVHHLEAPRANVERLLRAGARAYFILTPLRPLRTDRSWVDYFGRRHGPRLDLGRVGHQAAESRHERSPV
jgi:hypothetical protein